MARVFIANEGGEMQPFTVYVKASVMLLIDFHAHLLNTEVIGFLAGTWDAHNKCTPFHLQCQYLLSMV